MSKTLMAFFLGLLATILFSCTKPQPPTTERSGTEADVAPVATNTVVVSFAGLMVFHKETGKPGYEVGILVPSVSGGHRFSVACSGNSVKCNGLPIQFSNGNNWSLSVTNGQPPAAIASPVEIGHDPKRKPDNVNGQNDFSWIVDLESPEFHGKELTLIKGLLSPIIHLPNIPLYTEFKSIDLKRWQGIGPASAFGYVAETIAMKIDLRAGQEAVLKDNSKSIEILRLAYNPSGAPQRVEIANVMHPPPQASDFRLYYKIFAGITDSEKFDFDKNSDDLPNNPSLYLQLMTKHEIQVLPTCCGMLCDGILLGKRTAPLE